MVRRAGVGVRAQCSVLLLQLAPTHILHSDTGLVQPELASRTAHGIFLVTMLHQRIEVRHAAWAALVLLARGHTGTSLNLHAHLLDAT